MPSKLQGSLSERRAVYESFRVSDEIRELLQHVDDGLDHDDYRHNGATPLDRIMTSESRRVVENEPGHISIGPMSIMCMVELERLQLSFDHDDIKWEFIHVFNDDDGWFYPLTKNIVNPDRAFDDDDDDDNQGYYCMMAHYLYFLLAIDGSLCSKIRVMTENKETTRRYSEPSLKTIEKLKNWIKAQFKTLSFQLSWLDQPFVNGIPPDLNVQEQGFAFSVFQFARVCALVRKECKVDTSVLGVLNVYADAFQELVYNKQDTKIAFLSTLLRPQMKKRSSKGLIGPIHTKIIEQCLENKVEQNVIYERAQYLDWDIIEVMYSQDIQLCKTILSFAVETLLTIVAHPEQLWTAITKHVIPHLKNLCGQEVQEFIVQQMVKVIQVKPPITYEQVLAMYLWDYLIHHCPAHPSNGPFSLLSPKPSNVQLDLDWNQLQTVHGIFKSKTLLDDLAGINSLDYSQLMYVRFEKLYKAWFDDS